MKKKLLALTLCLTVCFSIAGCGQKPVTDSAQEEATVADETSAQDTQTDSRETGETATADNDTEKKQLKGTIDEIKDFMFVIKAEDGTYYAFPYDDQTNINIKDFAEGDSVTLTYTGTLSEVDSFTGTIVSMNK